MQKVITLNRTNMSIHGIHLTVMIPVCASQKFKTIEYINGERANSHSLSNNFISSDEGLNIIEYQVNINGTAFKIMNKQNKTSKSFSVSRKIINIQHAYIEDNTLYIVCVDNEKYTSALYGIDLNRKKIVYSKHINGWISATIAQNGFWYYCKEVADDNGVEEYVCRFNINNLSNTVMSLLDEFGDSVNFIELCGGYIFGFEENWIDLENYRFSIHASDRLTLFHLCIVLFTDINPPYIDIYVSMRH